MKSRPSAKKNTTERFFRKHLTILNEVCNKLSRAESFDELCQLASELCRSMLGFDRAGIWFNTDDPNRITGSYGTDENGNTRDERGITLTLNADSPFRTIYDSKKNYLLLDNTDLHNQTGKKIGHGSRAVATLWDGEEVIGYIGVDNLLHHKPITQHHGEILGLFANTLGHLCARMKVVEALQEKEEKERETQDRFRNLNEVANDLSRIEEKDEFCYNAVKWARERLGFDRFALFFRGEDPNTVVGTYGTDPKGEMSDEHFVTFPVEKTSLKLLELEKSGYIFKQDAKLGYMGKTIGRGAFGVAALWDGKRSIGYLATDNLTTKHPLTEEDCKFLQQYASSLGHLYARLCAQIELARREEKERAFQKKLSILNDIINELSRASSLDDLHHNAIRLGIERLGFDRLALFLVTDDPSILIGTWGTDEDGNLTDERDSIISEYEPEVMRQFTEGKKKYVFKKEEDLRFKGEIVGSGSTVDAPLWDGEKVVGILVCDNLITHNEITERNCNLLSQFAASLGHLSSLKIAEEETYESEKKYRALFEESKDVVFISTPEGKFLDINQAGVDLYGYDSKEELMEINIPEDLSWKPEDRDRLEELLDEQGYVKDFEIELKTKQGEKRVVLTSCTVVRDDEGNPIMYRGIWRDITEHKLLERQLIQAQKMDSLGTMAGGIAHDFNNILGGILGYASFAKTLLTKDNPIYGYLATIERSAERAAELTYQLLAFARGGKYNIQPSDLNDIIEDTRVIISRTFDRSIIIKTTLNKKIPTVEIDPSQFQQVIMNLCTNARDAMPGGGRLLIETEVVVISKEYTETHVYAKEGVYACMSVSDTGMGMEKEIREHIFEPFFTTKEKGKGTGLGLSLVYGVVKNHDGFVHVYSEIGEGTTVKVFIPVSGKPQRELPKEAIAAVGKNELVLIVDDEEIICNFVKDLLENNGYRVIIAEDGEKGVEMFEKHKDEISLVILDLVMPKLAGYETYKKMKQIKSGVPTLVSSGYSQVGRAQNVLDIGADSFLQKPYQGNRLLASIRQILDGGKKRQKDGRIDN